MYTHGSGALIGSKVISLAVSLSEVALGSNERGAMRGEIRGEGMHMVMQ